MEYKFLARYLQYKKAKEISFIEFIRNTSGVNKVMFILMILSLISMMIIDGVCPHSYLALVPIVVEILCIIVIDIGRGLDVRRKSKNNLDELDKKCDDLLKWLVENGYGEKNTIKQICFRCRKIIENTKERKKETIELLNKLFGGLIIPMCLAIIEAVLNDRIMNVAIVVQLVIVVFGFYIVLYAILKLVQDYVFKEVKEMDMMVEDLQDVLDRCFYIGNDDILR